MDNVHDDSEYLGNPKDQDLDKLESGPRCNKIVPENTIDPNDNHKYRSISFYYKCKIAINILKFIAFSLAFGILTIVLYDRKTEINWVSITLSFLIGFVELILIAIISYFSFKKCYPEYVTVKGCIYFILTD